MKTRVHHLRQKFLPEPHQLERFTTKTQNWIPNHSILIPSCPHMILLLTFPQTQIQTKFQYQTPTTSLPRMQIRLYPRMRPFLARWARCIGVDIGLLCITYVKIILFFPFFTSLVYFFSQAQRQLAAQFTGSNAPSGPEVTAGTAEEEEEDEDLEEIEIDDEDFTSTQR